MSRWFYGKLAVSNLRKNKSLYLPYILTAIGMCAVFYIMLAITGDKGIDQMMGAANLRMILGLGSVVVGIFSVIFLLYTNSFLMKRRKKEFGLFNILGMEKRHIGKMMFWETFINAIVSIGGGLLAGIILNKLVVLLLLRITHLKVPFGFTLSVTAAQSTVILFLGIFAVILLFNLLQVQKARPVELLKSTSQGEAEPKARFLIAVIGVAALAAGYFIAIVTKDPMGAVLLFFVAVILVMIGTYCLFTAGSIAVLKLLRRNKNYYYKTSHFTFVSGMIYRMKQNAVGLANICILSTAVLVMISATVSLYGGIGQAMNSRFPKDIIITGFNLTKQNKADLEQLAVQAAAENKLNIEDGKQCEILSVRVLKTQEKVSIITQPGEGEYNPSMISFMTLEEFERITGEKEELKENEIMVYTYRGAEGEAAWKINNKEFRIKKYIGKEAEKEFNTGENMVVVYDTYYAVVKDETVLSQIDTWQKEAYGENASGRSYNHYFNISGSAAEEKVYTAKLNQAIENYNGTVMPKESDSWIEPAESRESGVEDYYVMYGGFLFLGIFLGFVFLMATVMIIYYKQISEGYEDKERFEIMQKVGMSHKEVRAAIRGQILKVFFLPLIMAAVHLTAAFPLIQRLLALFGMRDITMFALCSVLTVAVFAVIYGVVYSITAKAYYKIVDGKSM